jgi:hypothetical protein
MFVIIIGILSRFAAERIDGNSTKTRELALRFATMRTKMTVGNWEQLQEISSCYSEKALNSAVKILE